MTCATELTSPSLSSGLKNKDRIALVGPCLPYRGGIAQHTTMLHRALQSKADCLTISFSRQYPKWLFPGKSDTDDSLKGYLEEGVEYIIDSINPLTWIAAVKRIRAFAPRLVVFPWWHVYWAPCFAWICRKLKQNHIEIVILCHNAVEHESSRWKVALGKQVLGQADRFVAHTSSDCSNLESRFPGKAVSVHPLPAFEHFPEPFLTLPRRGKLELLFFGFVRPYKGLSVLLEAMKLLKNEDVHLSIVGEFWRGEDEAKQFLNDQGIAGKVELVSHYVSDSDAAAFFVRCDVVVLPYLSATGSAVIPLAYHFMRPVIATRVGGLPDVVEEGFTGILIDANSSDQLVAAIRSILLGSRIHTNEGISAMKTKLTWDGLADVVLGSP